MSAPGEEGRTPFPATGGTREMTLEEWVETLPGSHSARSELAVLLELVAVARVVTFEGLTHDDPPHLIPSERLRLGLQQLRAELALRDGGGT